MGAVIVGILALVLAIASSGRYRFHCEKRQAIQLHLEHDEGHIEVSACQTNKSFSPHTHAKGAPVERRDTSESLYEAVGVFQGKLGNSNFNASQDGKLFNIPCDDIPDEDTIRAGNATAPLSASAGDSSFYENPVQFPKLHRASGTAHALEGGFVYDAVGDGTKLFDDSSPANIYSAVFDLEPCVNGPSGRQLPSAISRDSISLISRLGSGAFGEVWKAELNESSSPGGRPGYLVAVKKVKRGAPACERLELLKEAALMAQLTGEAGCHPNVLSFVGLVDDGAGPTLAVITYCEHGSLDKYLERHGPTGALDVAFRIGVGEQVAGGMTYLARCGVVHRDLAARNVLLDSRKIVRVADFGLARRSSIKEVADESIYAVYETGESSVIRIPVRWAAPEVFNGLRFTTSSDVWSFAMLMVEVFTDGEQPFSGTPQSKVFETVVAGVRPQQPRLCTDAVFKVLRQCWSANSQQRPSFKILERQFEGLAKNVSREIGTMNEANIVLNDEVEAKPDGDAEGYEFPLGVNAASGRAPLSHA
jgi:hypothetical protein